MKNIQAEKDQNEYVDRLKYIGKLKREWYQRGFREGRILFAEELKPHLYTMRKEMLPNEKEHHNAFVRYLKRRIKAILELNGGESA